MATVALLGCMVKDCKDNNITIHHCGTYIGGGRDHTKIISLCWNHHLGPEGIDGKRMSKRQWEEKYGTEEMLLERVRKLLASR